MINVLRSTFFNKVGPSTSLRSLQMQSRSPVGELPKSVKAEAPPGDTYCLAVKWIERSTVE